MPAETKYISICVDYAVMREDGSGYVVRPRSMEQLREWLASGKPPTDEGNNVISRWGPYPPILWDGDFHLETPKVPWWKRLFP